VKYFAIAAVALAIYCVANSSIATQTFQFDADVTNVFAGPVAPSLPFAIHTGDVIHGTFSFEPTSIGKAGRQNTGISFTFNGEALTSTSFDVLPVLNIGPPSSYADDITAAPMSESGGSALQLYCGISTECSPDKLPNNSLVSWDFFATLESDSPTITEYRVPADVNVWNAFSTRSLNLSFFTGDIGGGVLVFATMGSMVATPEPSTLAILLAGAVVTTMRRNRRQVR
jgi:hypothetical protein